MSRSHLPPTPAMSGELTIKEQSSVDAADTFALPPAAISPVRIVGASRKASKPDPSLCFPASPASPNPPMGSMAKSPRQTGIKRPLEEFDLPPPPTRTRRIIQMKPKTQSQPKPVAPASSKASTKDNASKGTANNGNTPNSKKKQPSATSAAGRKIARKTAHSLIERRRRSKMNEEFATLKDMIPACQGQDMHKLAILQASIDYVNYLEQCILDLKTAAGAPARKSPTIPPAPPSPTSPEALGPAESGPSSPDSVSPALLPTEASTSNATSPIFSAQPFTPVPGSVPDFRCSFAAFSVPEPVQPSPETTRSARGSWVASSASTSPGLGPQYPIASPADVDHEASAALLMLNRDCRGSVGSAHDARAPSVQPARREGSNQGQYPQRKLGMSVMDLLIP
ncbi:basic helix-loop-helix domain-containing protein [Aspergillus saccharolyticus JOP 1030-1]|uniref:HLH-domain-containing protein n=1 Tax=Aspergillus saccharolyticus JOP 1030-1 TaxID=1450539 RepID=A0A318ZKQ7_9EURO|nr:HLH-domain-containing protein [Aspergillus saccharolyticus JOP 1030-1]PYH44370.1 HLH-domain-containing protein [Aspergillus saccharolyticus JOP 1030-1]